MANQARDYEKELSAILDGIAESVEEMTDEEIVQDVREQSCDPRVAAEQVRQLLRDADKSYRQRNLIAAREEHERRLAGLRERKVTLPDSPEGRRNLLAAVWASKPEIGAAMTAQHRNFEELTDHDVEGLLLEMGDLGVLDDLQE